MKGPIVETSYGKLQGRQEGGVHVWRGVPFAAPPVGELRFRAPQAPEAWSGVREASEFGPVSHQPPDTRGTRFGGQAPVHSEDCLYLNIWSPAVREEPLPVMVWIHGGTFVTGAGSQPQFDGTSFAERGNVILVSINYRLGPFGFMHLSPFGEELSSNQGLLDQIAALKWVKENIAAFGGDPQRVTVFGESAGSMSIAALLAMPAAKGLFCRAIMQSGAAQTLNAEQAKAIAATLLAELGITPGGDTSLLHTLPTDQLIEAAGRVMVKITGGSMGMLYQPVVDGDTLPIEPLQAVSEGAAQGISLLIGTNRDEGNLFFREGAPVADFDQSLLALEQMMGTGSLKEIASHYSTTWEGQAKIMTDLYFWGASVTLAESQLTYAPVWMYRFDGTIPGHPLLCKAVHGAEIVYAFNNLSHLTRLGAEITPAMQQLADAMHESWISFAHHGNPNTSLAVWPEYNLDARATLIFDEKIDVDYDPESEKRKRIVPVLA